LRLLFGIILVGFLSLCKSQVLAPDLRCVSVNTVGDVTLTWIKPSDPLGQFFSYEIFYSNTYSGTYTFVAAITNYTATTLFHTGTPGPQAHLGSKYYCIRTKWGAGGASVSAPLDTLRSIYLNLGGAGTGTATMVYNNLHVPRKATSATTFTVMREFPPPAWSSIATPSITNYNDVITRCNVFYKYQILLSDASGCTSASNYAGANFKDQTAPDQVLNTLQDSVSVNSTGQSILGWNPSSNNDCSAYVIYQGSGSSWNVIDTVFGINNTVYTTTNTSANANPVNYCIASLDSCGNIGVLGTPFTTIHLTTKYNICDRSVDLSWNSYSSMPLGVMLYKVYRSVNSGPYQYLGNINGTSYTDTGLTPGQTYCYMVRAVNTPGSITASSNRSCFVATAPPSTSFVYLESASVDTDESVLLTVYCDTLVACKGFNVLKSEDGVTFTQNGFIPYTGRSTLYYKDANVSTSYQNYFYKAQVVDSCGNPRFTSNTGKTMVLHVKNDENMIFKNNLTWDDYSTYSGGVAGYYVFRVVNEVMDPVPVSFIPFGTTTYTDNVEDIVSESGKVGYVVQAIEGFGNIYGLSGASNSNKAVAYAEAAVFVPNSFAPKGENRIWMPVAQFVEKSDYHVTVFNRWGVKVWETTSDTEGWNGSGYDDNTYVYLVQYKNARGEFIEQKGTVTIIR